MIRYLFEKIILILDNSSQKRNFSFLRNLVGNQIDIFFDVGFHEGETTILANKYFSIKEIHAFEPNPDIPTSYYENKIKNIFLINKGVGRKDCNKTFFINNFSPINSFFKVNNKSKHTKLKSKILSFIYSAKINSRQRNIEIIALKNYCIKQNISKIDILKIDTEGSEYDVLVGLGEKIKNVKCILFEHHYDKSLIKNYKFSDIHNFLIKNGFTRVFKTKMLLRNIFEYIYINRKLNS